MNGIRFGEVHSFEDLNLILSKADLPPAAVKTVYVDNPGGDGSWDLTEATGKVNYKNREAKFTFSVLPEDDFEAKKTEVSNLLNGKRFKITLDKDPEYYWDGRCTVNQYESNKKMRKIVVGASVAPYKMKREKTRVFVPFCGKNFASNNVNDWETIFNVSISNNVMTGQNVGGASNYTYLKTLLPRGTFVASGEFQGLVRFLVKLFDDNGKILTNNDILGFGAFNSYYKGFYFSETPKVLRIPNKAAYWQFGVVFTASGEATNLTITNLQLEFGETATEYESYVASVPTGKNIVDISQMTTENETAANYASFVKNGDGTYTLTKRNGSGRGWQSKTFPVYIPAGTPFTFSSKIISEDKPISAAIVRTDDWWARGMNSTNTEPYDVVGVFFYFPVATADGISATFKDFQLEIGTTATEYEPFTTDHNITLSNGRKTVSPTIICTDEAKIKVNGAEFALGEGANKILDFSIEEGENTVTIGGSGAAAIVYQEGDL